MVVSGEATDAAQRNVAIFGLELTDALKRVSTQIEMEPLAPILNIQAELEHDDSETLRNVATSRAVLHSRVAEVRCSLLETN